MFTSLFEIHENIRNNFLDVDDQALRTAHEKSQLEAIQAIMLSKSRMIPLTIRH